MTRKVIATTNELKPCPFCNSKAEIDNNRTEEDIQDWWYVYCTNPNCAAQTTQWYLLDDAIEAWNKRYSNSQHNSDAWDNALRKLLEAVSEISKIIKSEISE